MVFRTVFSKICLIEIIFQLIHKDLPRITTENPNSGHKKIMKKDAWFIILLFVWYNSIVAITMP